MKICVLQPTYRFVPTESYQSMVNLLYHFFAVKDTVIQFAISDNIKIDHVRNYLTQLFLEKDGDKIFDYVMWIDSDQVFNPGQVEQLIDNLEKNQLDIISGLYHKRTSHILEAVAFDEVGDKFISIIPNKSGLQEVEGVGFGFVLMRPKVLREMHKEYGARQFEFQYIVDGNEYLGEDLTWSQRARKLGYKIWLDCDCIIGHKGAIV